MSPTAAGIFAEIVEVKVRLAWEKLTPQLDSFLSEEAQIALRQSLAKRLQNTGGQVFDWIYKIFLQTPGFPSKVSFLEEEEAVRSYYFPNGVERETQRLLETYPELARLWNLQVESWLVFAGEILQHSRAFIGENETVTDLQMDLADLHNGNRSVAWLTFSNGETWYYKPRSGEGEKGWFDLLQWVNEEGFETPFQIVRVIPSQNHSWMEAVEPRPCESEAEVETFYFRAGAQLHLYYLLGGIDLHAGNFIAAGPHPVIIDCETLFHPKIKDANISDEIEKSVLRCGMLPAIFKDDIPRQSVSALGDGDMGRHTVWLYASRIHVFDQIKSLLAGYRVMNDFLEIRRNIFLDKAEKMASLTWRRVIRPTGDYLAFLQQSLSANGLRNRHQILAEHLGSSPHSAREIAELLAGDIPFFHQPGSTFQLHNQDGLELSMKFIRQALEK